MITQRNYLYMKQENAQFNWRKLEEKHKESIQDAYWKALVLTAIPLYSLLYYIVHTYKRVKGFDDWWKRIAYSSETFTSLLIAIGAIALLIAVIDLTVTMSMSTPIDILSDSQVKRINASLQGFLISARDTKTHRRSILKVQY